MNLVAQKLANNFDMLFTKKTRGMSGYEIPIFRAMKDALIGVSNNSDVEEYHGTSKQVRFSGDNINARSNARCELSDLMIIVCSPKSKDVRLTYLQAKSERTKVNPSFYSQFHANFEQWYLLSQRPLINGVGSFNPPQDLLSNALYPSIGTFAFFYKNMYGNFETFYASANNLKPVNNTKSRQGKVELNDKSSYFSVVNGYKECISSINNYYFAYHLFNLSIGTPISSNIAKMKEVRNWLCMNLRGKIENAKTNDDRTSLAEELISILEPETQDIEYGDFGAKDLLIFKAEQQS